MHRRLVLSSLALGATGCAKGRGPLVLPDPRPLITPQSGRAVLYLLRIPLEGFDLIVHVDGVRMALLPKASFTAIALPPGAHEVLAIVQGGTLPSVPATVTLAEGERRFLYSAAPTRGSVSSSFVPLKSTAILVFIPTQTTMGARRWTEMSEFDAQGMMSVLEPIGAEENAP